MLFTVLKCFATAICSRKRKKCTKKTRTEPSKLETTPIVKRGPRQNEIDYGSVVTSRHEAQAQRSEVQRESQTAVHCNTQRNLYLGLGQDEGTSSRITGNGLAVSNPELPHYTRFTTAAGYRVARSRARALAKSSGLPDDSKPRDATVVTQLTTKNLALLNTHDGPKKEAVQENGDDLRQKHLRAPHPFAQSKALNLDQHTAGLKSERIKTGGGLSSREIHIRALSKGRDLLTPLSHHQNIINRVMVLCFPSSMYIYEYPKGTKIGLVQTQYEVYDRNALDGQRSSHRTTYFGSSGIRGTSHKAAILRHLPSRNKSNCIGLLRVNKAFQKLGSKHLFNRSFHFRCSAQGAEAFLTSHKPYIKHIRKLTLCYEFRADPALNSIETDDEAWHKLMCLIRHELSPIPIIEINIGKDFWTLARWRQGAAAVIGQRSLTNKQSYTVQPSFLFDVAKIAAPADRWLDHRDELTRRCDGTKVVICIEESIDESRKKFVAGLNEEVKRRQLDRPLMIMTPWGGKKNYTRARNERVYY